MESKAEMKLKDLHVFDSHIKCTFQDVGTKYHTMKYSSKIYHGYMTCFRKKYVLQSWIY